LSDRVESAKALLKLTDSSNPTAIELMRLRALPSLAEMARWKTPRYALPAYLLLGRVAGVAEQEVQRKWEAGERESVIGKALTVPGRKRGG